MVFLAVADGEHVVAGDHASPEVLLQVVVGSVTAFMAIHHSAGIVFVLERGEFVFVLVKWDLVGHEGYADV